MTFENTEVYGIENAVRGMRNPMMSHGKSDSIWHEYDDSSKNFYEVGPADNELALRLIAAGEPHRKFLRQIFVSTDICKLPSYLLHELATYKVGTTLDCSSTMHKITSRDLTINDFEKPETLMEKFVIGDAIIAINHMRKDYIAAKEDADNDKAERIFRGIKRILPSGYCYERATWTANYEVLRNIWYWRHNHRLPAWHEFCQDFIEKLPYHEFITTPEKK